MSTNRCKKVRSIIAMLLAVVMMTGMLPTSAFAAGEEITGADGIGNEIIADDGMVERGDGESAEDTVSIGGPDEKGEGNTEDAVGSGEESSQDGNDGTADDSKSPDEVKDNSSPDSESSLEVSIPDGESFDEEEGLSDPYAGEDTPVSVTPLYGSPQNSSGPRRAPARASGTITTGLDMGYNRKWMAEFAPYSSAVEKFFNGQPAYCIEPHKGAPGAGTSVDASAYWGDQRVRLALAYGYGGADDSTLLWYAGNGTYAWCATQEVIWEIVGGYSDLSDLFVGPGHQYDPEVAEPIKAAHDYIWDMINQQAQIPSFAVGRPTQTYNDFELVWDGTSWSLTRTDTNRVLRNFGRFKFSLSGVSTSRSGNNLTITATPEAARSMLNGIVSLPCEGNVIDPDSVNAYLLVAGGSKQNCVALNGTPDPVTCYVRAKVTQTTGNLNITKTSENGKNISNVSFTVTGPNGYNRLFKTNTSGKISITDLQPGAYTITETSPLGYYAVNRVQTATVTIGGTASVSFQNKVSRCTVQVTKTSEDGVLQGFTFTLKGTSYAGDTVNLSATTDANGKATFSNVPLGSNYVLAEVNTPRRYVAPASQTFTLSTPNTSVTKTFENKLARGNVTVTKTSEDGKVSGVQFNLKGTSLSGQTVNLTETTNASGMATFSNVLVGTYTLTEVNTGRQYAPVSAQNVTVQYNSTARATVSNKLARGSVQVTKSSEDGKVANVKFRLQGTSIDGTAVDLYAVTNASGVATFSNVLIGSYIVSEVNVPAYYQAVNPVNVTVTINRKSSVSVQNRLKVGAVQVTKTSEDGVVSNLSFTLTGTSDAGTTVSMTAKTDAQGVATFSNVPIGTRYTVQESSTPTRYVVPDVQDGVTVRVNDTTKLSFHNDLARGSLRVTKTSEDGFVSGVKFHLEGTSTSGAAVSLDATTNAAGIAEFKNVLVGSSYVLTEVDTAARYVVPAVQNGIVITVGKTTEASVCNKLARGTVTVTKTAEDGLVSGIKFRLTGTAGNGDAVDMTATTNAKGVATFSDVLIGENYSVREVGTAEKYIVPDVVSGINVTLNKTTNANVHNKLARGTVSVTKTSEDGIVEGIKFHLTGTSAQGQRVDMMAVTNASGIATFNNVLVGYNYALEEVDTAARYVIPAVKGGINVKLDKTTTVSVHNVLKKWSVTVTKRDIETTTAQGNATLQGAVYGLYNGDELVKQYTTDANGKFATDVYVCGDNWTIKEIVPSVGYLLDDSVYQVGAEAKNYVIEINAAPDLGVTEKVIKGYIKIFKHSDVGPTGVEESLPTGKVTPEVGAEFDVYLKAAGSYAAAKTTDRDHIVVDEDGYATTKALPYGTYVIEQTKHFEHADMLSGFEVTISENGKTYFYVLNDRPYYASVRVVKQDAMDNVQVPYSGAEFQIYDPDGTLVSLKAGAKNIDTFRTDNDGNLITPEELPFGRGYKLVETKAPRGYRLNSTPVIFNVDFESTTMNDGEKVVVVKMTDVPVTPQIKTVAKGEAGEKTMEPLTSVTIKDTVSCTDVIPGKTYTVNGYLVLKSTGEPLLDGAGHRITATNTFVGGNNFEGSTVLSFTFDASLIAGDAVVVYDTLHRDGVEVATHKSISDADQTVSFFAPEIKTSAVNPDGNVKVVDPSIGVSIVDTVSYKHLTPGHKYILKGQMMDRDTQQPAKDDNGTYIVGTTNFTPATTEGSVDVTFTFDATEIAGVQLVAFEKLYHVAISSDIPVATHEDIEDAEQTVTVEAPEITTHATNAEDGTKFLDPQYMVKVRDSVAYEKVVKGHTYLLTGKVFDKTTGEFVKDAAGNEITGTTRFTPTAKAGTVDVEFVFDASELYGHTLVVFEKLSYRGVVLTVHEDEADAEQTVNVYSPKIGTTAIDGEGTGKFLDPAKNVVIKDTIAYEHLTIGQEYTIIGTVMNKRTSEAVVSGGRTVTVTNTFTPSASKGSTEMVFTFDASGLDGESLVVYEELYFRASDSTPCAIHKDIGDEGQTVVVNTPAIHTTINESISLNNYFEPLNEITITDTVTYTDLVPGHRYKVKGNLVSKDTGDVIRDGDGNLVSGEADFVPTTKDGNIDVKFTLNASILYGQSVIAFESLYYHNTVIAEHKDLADEKQEAVFFAPALSTKALNNDGNTNLIDPAKGTHIVDTVYYRHLTPDHEYTVVGKLMDKMTGLPLLDAKGDEITGKTVFTPQRVAGAVNVEFTFDASNMAGKTLVVFEYLYFNEGDEIPAGTHTDISDLKQSLTFSTPAIKTSAKNAEDNSKFFDPKSSVRLVDTVSYEGLCKGHEYTVNGVLMDKKTGTPVLNTDGNPVTGTTSFTARSAAGKVKVEFVFDASQLYGKSLVVFEELVFNGTVIAEHRDLDDRSQTVTINVPSISTRAVNTDGKGKMLDAAKETSITDTVSYSHVTPGHEYTLVGRLMNGGTGEEIPGTATRVKFTPKRTSGDVDVTFALDASRLAGKNVVVFEELFFNETDAAPCATHKDLRDEAQTVTVMEPSIGTTMKASPDKNQFFVSSLSTVLVDTVTYHNLIPGHTYVAEGCLVDKATGRVLVGGNGEISGRTVFVPKSMDGSVDVYFTFDSSELFGKTVVAFETVSYGGHIIAKHEDINDVDQSATFYNPELTNTTAVNGEGGSKYIDAARNVVIKDTVKYAHLPIKHDFKLRGTLVFQSSGEPILLNNKPIVVEKSFTAKKAEGSIDMEFVFDASGLQGKKIVVFEELFYENQTIAAAVHKDLGDVGQTVTVSNPKVKTVASNKVDGSKMLEPDKRVTILDTVSFSGLIEGHTYKVSGTLMDKATGNPVVDESGETITAEKTFKAKAAGGSVDVEFTFAATELYGKDIVVFEKIFCNDTEIASHENINDREQTVTVYAPNITGTTAVGTLGGGKLIDPAANVKITDTVMYEHLSAGHEYTLRGTLMNKETGEPIKNGGTEVVVEQTFTPVEASGSVDMQFVFTASFLKGKDIVVFEEIYFNSEDTEPVAVHRDIDDGKQTVSVTSPEVRTVAVNKEDNGKVFEPDQTVTLKDTVFYNNLIVGHRYTVTGTLMDKGTGKPIKDTAGSIVASSVEFTPDAPCGTVDVEFPFAATELYGKTIVAFEKLLFNGTVIASHEDINDEEQTTTVHNPEIVRTVALSAVDGEKFIDASETSTINDTVVYRHLSTGHTYTLRSSLVDKTTGEPVLNNGIPVVSEMQFTPESTAGSAVAAIAFDASAAKGRDIVVFEELFFTAGDEAPVAAHKDIEDADQTVTVVKSSIKTCAENAADGTKVFEPASEVILKDTVDYEGIIAGHTYKVVGTLMDKSTGKPVEAAAGKSITAEKVFTPESENGSVVVEFKFDAREFFGRTLVVFEDLYYGETVVASHRDINDENQSVEIKKPVIVETIATNKVDGGKLVDPTEKVVLTDSVKYDHLSIAHKYTLVGKLMDKSTGESLKDKDGNSVVASTFFTPNNLFGSVEVLFEFDGSSLAGKDIVVFEYLYYNEGDKTALATHEDLEDTAQTVTFANPAVKTSAANASTGKKTFSPYEKAELVDTVTYEGLIPGHEYTLVGTLVEKVKSGGNWVEGKPVMDKDKKPLTATATFTPEKAEGTTTVSFVFGARSVAGKTLVVYEELLYNNMSVTTHADITDENQTVTVDRIHYSGPTMGTTATFANGSKSSGYASRLVVVDTVSYSGLTVGQNYTLVGRLMDAQTGEALRDAGGREVTSKLTFTPKASDGSIDMKFSFAASNIKGAKVVVFEELYVGGSVDGTPYLSHTDINDAGQTVTVTASPKTGDDGVGKYVSLGSIALGTAIIVVVVSNVKRRKKNK